MSIDVIIIVVGLIATAWIIHDQRKVHEGHYDPACQHCGTALEDGWCPHFCEDRQAEEIDRAYDAYYLDADDYEDLA